MRICKYIDETAGKLEKQTRFRGCGFLHQRAHGALSQSPCVWLLSYLALKDVGPSCGGGLGLVRCVPSVVLAPVGARGE